MPSPDLSRLRAESTAGTAAAEQESRTNNATAVDRAEQQRQALETPLGEAAGAAEAWMRAVDALIRAQWGPLPWVRYTGLGKVLTINRAGGWCTVALASDTGAPVAERHVRIGAGTPVVGKQYPVFQPYQVPPDPDVSLLAGPVPAGDPWLHAPAGSRWLYRKVYGEAVMERWPWPPPAADQPWEAETVQDGLDLTLQLFGGTKDGDDPVQILCFRTTPNFVDYYPNTDDSIRVGFDYHVTPFPRLGFDPPAASWMPVPSSTRLQASANDSTAIVGRDVNYVIAENPGWINVGLGRLKVSGHETCCLPWPPGAGPDPGLGPYCAEVFHYEAELNTQYGPIIRVPFEQRALGVQAAAPPVFQAAQTYPNTLQTLRPPTTTAQGTFQDSVASGCHWFYSGIFPLLVVWDSLVTITKYYTTSFTPAAKTVFSGRFAPAGSVVRSGAWDDRAAYVFTDWEQYKSGPAWDAYGTRDGRYWLYSWQGHRDVTPLGYDDHAAFLDVQYIGLAGQGSDTETLLLYGQYERFDSGTVDVRRWQDGTWTILAGIQRLDAVSRDGQDVLGARTDGQPVYSQDAGETWTPCAALPRAVKPAHDGLEFIDEL